MTNPEYIETAEPSAELFEGLAITSVIQGVSLRVGDRIYIAETRQTDVQEVLSVLLRVQKIKNEYMKQSIRGNADIRQVTVKLADRWNEETLHIFSLRDKTPPANAFMGRSTITLGSLLGQNGELIEDNSVARIKTRFTWKQQFPGYDVSFEEVPQK